LVDDGVHVEGMVNFISFAPCFFKDPSEKPLTWTWSSIVEQKRHAMPQGEK
jgi:hypothetical protein